MAGGTAHYDQTYMRYLQSWLGNGDVHTDPRVRLGDSDTGAVDAFGRLRTSDPVTLFDSSMVADDQALLWETFGNGTAAWAVNESAVTLSVPADGTVGRQTYQYSHYQPGKSLLVAMTGVMGTPVADVTKRWGYFDDNNGIFWELDGSGTVYLVQRTNVTGTPVDRKVAQADWNVDTFSTMDATKSQIWFADLEWLGVGRVRTGFYVAGVPHVCHQFLNANIRDSVYMSTGSLPCRYEAVSAGGTAADMKQICSMVASEGGLEVDTGAPFSADTGAAARSAGTAGLPVIAIRPKQTYGAGSVIPRSTIIPESFHANVQTNSARIQVVYGGTVQGGSWVSVAGNSTMEYNIGGTAIVGGFSVYSTFLQTTGTGSGQKGQADHGLTSKLPLARSKDGTAARELAIMVYGMGGAAATNAAMNWVELPS